MQYISKILGGACRDFVKSGVKTNIQISVTKKKLHSIIGF